MQSSPQARTIRSRPDRSCHQRGLAGQGRAEAAADADALGWQNGGNRHCGYRFFGERKCAECVLTAITKSESTRGCAHTSERRQYLGGYPGCGARSVEHRLHVRFFDAFAHPAARCAGAASAGSYTISVELKTAKTEAFTADRERFNRPAKAGRSRHSRQRTEVHAAADAHKRLTVRKRRDRSAQRRAITRHAFSLDAEKVWRTLERTKISRR